MAINLTNTYSVTTPPYQTDMELGSLYTIAHRQFRYCALEAFNDSTLQAGVFVTLETNSLGVNIAKQLSSAVDVIYGVSYLNNLNIATWNNTLGAFEFPSGTNISIISEGDVWMYAEAAVTVGSSVYTRHTADGLLTRIGALAGAAGTGLIAVPGVKFLKTLTASGKVPVSLPDII